MSALLKRTDKTPTPKEQQRADIARRLAIWILAKTNPKIDNNIIRGYN
jgi:hypothetical protein